MIKTPIYRAVASSTAIETGVSVQKIEQQLKLSLARAKAVGPVLNATDDD